MKNRINRILIFSLGLIIFAGFGLSAQVEQKPAEKVEAEVVQMTKEEKKAVISKKREAAKERNRKNMLYRTEAATQKDQLMFKAVGLNEKQIASYNKIQAENKSDMRKAALKNKDDRSKFVEKVQQIREKNNAALKALFTEEQFKKYMDFNETGGSAGAKAKKGVSKTLDN